MNIQPRKLQLICTIPCELLKQNGWRLNDVSLSLTGDKIALSGDNEDKYQTFVRVYSTEPGNEGTLLYQKDYEEGIGSPTLFGRRISFMVQDRGEVLVTCWNKQAEVIDFNRAGHVVFASRQLDEGLTRCMSVSGRHIFIGRTSNTIDIYNEQLNKIREITLQGLRDGDFPCDIAAAEDGTLLVCTHFGTGGMYLQADGTRRGDYSTSENKVHSMAKNNETGQREVVAVLYSNNTLVPWSGKIVVYSINGQVFNSYDVNSKVSIIRISRGKIVTGSQDRHIVEISNLFQEINIERPRHEPIRQRDDSNRQVALRHESGCWC